MNSALALIAITGDFYKFGYERYFRLEIDENNAKRMVLINHDDNDNDEDNRNSTTTSTSISKLNLENTENSSFNNNLENQQQIDLENQWILGNQRQQTTLLATGSQHFSTTQSTYDDRPNLEQSHCQIANKQPQSTLNKVVLGYPVTLKPDFQHQSSLTTGTQHFSTTQSTYDDRPNLEQSHCQIANKQPQSTLNKIVLGYPVTLKPNCQRTSSLTTGSQHFSTTQSTYDDRPNLEQSHCQIANKQPQSTLNKIVLGYPVTLKPNCQQTTSLTTGSQHFSTTQSTYDDRPNLEQSYCQIANSQKQPQSTLNKIVLGYPVTLERDCQQTTSLTTGSQNFSTTQSTYDDRPILEQSYCQIANSQKQPQSTLNKIVLGYPVTLERDCQQTTSLTTGSQNFSTTQSTYDDRPNLEQSYCQIANSQKQPQSTLNKIVLGYPVTLERDCQQTTSLTTGSQNFSTTQSTYDDRPILEQSPYQQPVNSGQLLIAPAPTMLRQALENPGSVSSSFGRFNLEQRQDQSTGSYRQFFIRNQFGNRDNQQSHSAVPQYPGPLLIAQTPATLKQVLENPGTVSTSFGRSDLEKRQDQSTASYRQFFIRNQFGNYDYQQQRQTVPSQLLIAPAPTTLKRALENPDTLDTFVKINFKQRINLTINHQHLSSNKFVNSSTSSTPIRVENLDFSNEFNRFGLKHLAFENTNQNVKQHQITGSTDHLLQTPQSTLNNLDLETTGTLTMDVDQSQGQIVEPSHLMPTPQETSNDLGLENHETLKIDLEQSQDQITLSTYHLKQTPQSTSNNLGLENPETLTMDVEQSLVQTSEPCHLVPTPQKTSNDLAQENLETLKIDVEQSKDQFSELIHLLPTLATTKLELASENQVPSTTYNNLFYLTNQTQDQHSELRPLLPKSSTNGLNLTIETPGTLRMDVEQSQNQITGSTKPLLLQTPQTTLNNLGLVNVETFDNYVDKFDMDQCQDQTSASNKLALENLETSKMDIEESEEPSTTNHNLFDLGQPQDQTLKPDLTFENPGTLKMDKEQLQPKSSEFTDHLLPESTSNTQQTIENSGSLDHRTTTSTTTGTQHFFPSSSTSSSASGLLYLLATVASEMQEIQAKPELSFVENPVNLPSEPRKMVDLHTNDSIAIKQSKDISSPNVSKTNGAEKKSYDNDNKLPKTVMLKILNNIEISFPYSIARHLVGSQLESFRWLWSHHVKRLGSVLMFEQENPTENTKKILQIVALLMSINLSDVHDYQQGPNRRYRSLGPVLIICPNTSILLWLTAFRQFCPNFRVDTLDYGQDRSIINGAFNANAILISSYRTAGLYSRQQASKLRWHYLIVDEGHKIRNPDSKFAKQCKTIQAYNRIVLVSGGFIPANLRELWSLLDCIQPGRFGLLDCFFEFVIDPIRICAHPRVTDLQIKIGQKCLVFVRDSIRRHLFRMSPTNPSPVQDNTDSSDSALPMCTSSPDSHNSPSSSKLSKLDICPVSFGNDEQQPAPKPIFKKGPPGLSGQSKQHVDSLATDSLVIVSDGADRAQSQYDSLALQTIFGESMLRKLFEKIRLIDQISTSKRLLSLRQSSSAYLDQAAIKFRDSISNQSVVICPESESGPESESASELDEIFSRSDTGL